MPINSASTALQNDHCLNSAIASPDVSVALRGVSHSLYIVTASVKMEEGSEMNEKPHSLRVNCILTLMPYQATDVYCT